MRLVNQHKIIPIKKLVGVPVNIDGVRNIADFEVIETVNNSHSYPSLLGLDWAFDNQVIINLKKREMIFEGGGLKVSKPLDPTELDRVRIIYIEDDEGEDYLRRFTLADNDILIRYIRYFRPRLNYSTAIEMIWNSRFTWQQIKQLVEDYTYEFNFKSEFFLIGDPSEVVVDGSDTEEDESDRVEYEVISSDTEEEEDEVNRSARAAAVDALPEVVIGEEKENGDVAMCAVCGETFSSGESAKRLACTHLYHSKCILKWFDRNQSCPICRRQLVLIEGSLVVLNLNEQG
jgi:hypothetical protein